ncbi:MAG: SAM-dependent methyltransferase [Ruminococcaceae bacterium]|nr:SAM-dependent methyltransferase [Oscillospiraceae bacterium]
MINNNALKKPSVESFLSPRLLLIANAAKGTGTVLDIGTDHAYVPIYMVLKHGAKRAIAADINKGPLERAEENIKKFGLSDKITTCLSDGLKEFSPLDADTVIIAGMGGTLISRILDDSPQMKEEGIKFVLQPMTAEDELRRYLEKNGYEITDEFMTCEGEKLYTVITAEKGTQKKCEEVFYHVSKKLYEKKDRFFRLFLERKINEFKKVNDGLKRAENSDENTKRKEYCEEMLSEFLRLKGECDRW